ncbi:MAG: hypothetical protein IT317_10665 [Anaerolineales bacterium]|nr:hypothetical protein [Anaerolineales bacterium]
MNSDTLVTIVSSGLGLFLLAVLTQGLRVIRYANSSEHRIHQRLSQLRR